MNEEDMTADEQAATLDEQTGKAKCLSKNIILNQVWKYSQDADTHTVETHIYRLRKKISNIFDDDKFIVSREDGYFIE